MLLLSYARQREPQVSKFVDENLPSFAIEKQSFSVPKFGFMVSYNRGTAELERRTSKTGSLFTDVRKRGHRIVVLYRRNHYIFSE